MKLTQDQLIKKLLQSKKEAIEEIHKFSATDEYKSIVKKLSLKKVRTKKENVRI